jgi:CheY-like chemotaxis protein
MTWQVLLVEDDAELRDALLDILAAQGYQVRTAANGEEALRRVRELRPAVIVLDLMMPVMTGGTFLELRANDPVLASVPVIVLTAQPRNVAPDADVLGVMVKPLQLARLFALIHQACDRPFRARFATGTSRSGALPIVGPAADHDGHRNPIMEPTSAADPSAPTEPINSIELPHAVPVPSGD